MRGKTSMKIVLGFVVLALVGTVAAAEDRAPTDPIPGADVKVGKKPPGGGTIVAQGTTDAQGFVRFAELPAGQYFVRVSLAGKSWEIAADGAERRARPGQVDPDRRVDGQDRVHHEEEQREEHHVDERGHQDPALVAPAASQLHRRSPRWA